MFSRRNKGNRPARGSSSYPLHPQAYSGSHVPQVRVTDAQISPDHDDYRRDQLGVPAGSYPEPEVAAQSDRKKPASLMRRIREKLSPVRNKPSTPESLGPSRPTTPFLQPSGDDAVPPPSPRTPTAYVDDPRESSGTHATPDNRPNIYAQLEREDVIIPSVSEPTTVPSANSGSDRTKVIIGATRLVLQNAADALKFVPIANLDAIPNLLLTWLQVYETVGGNDDELEGLDDHIRKAYTTILQPLELSTDQIPPEVIQFIKGFHLALQGQITKIESLKTRNLATKAFLAAEIANRISGVKMCINDALNSFSTQTTILTLLRTIEASVQSKLERLPWVAAEHTYVKSKSECLPSTRVNIQNSLLNHLKVAENRFVWLRGSPGTGKTAISMSIASTLEKEGTLAASFFWDKNQKGTGLDSLERFPSTLARQLAIFNGDFKVSLVKRLRKPDSELVLSLSLEKQMRALVLEPMNGLRGIFSAGKERFTIILDGLDECGGSEVLKSLMSLVLLLDELPSAFSILVSCRPERQVISVWGGQGIPCENVDEVASDETFDTIRQMVRDGLKDCMRESRWEPSTDNLDAFASACRGLPVMASIRIREVQFQTQSGSDLESEFEYFLNLQAAPQDLNQEYLRIMRRAFRPRLSRIRPHIEKNYREVVGILVAAKEPLSVYSMSHLLGIADGKIHAILDPLSSIISVPPNSAEVKFYHATAKEFITGVPIGDDEDKGFFIDDPKGYFLGLRLLRFVNNTIQRNEIGLPTELPLGDKKKWDNFLISMKGQPDYVMYSFKWLFSHLNPVLLFSEESNELQGEFERLLMQNLFSFLAVSRAEWRKHESVWGEWCDLDEFTDHESIKLLNEAFRSIEWLVTEFDPWALYRYSLPFTPSSSHLHQVHGKLSDPVRIFSISGEFSGDFIPLSEDGHKAREAMEAKLPKNFDKYGHEKNDYKAEFAEPDIRNGILTCAAISQDGSHVALGFGSGVIEVADIDHQRTISRFQCNPPKPPVWIEFIGGGNVQIATEDTDGNISILSHGTRLVPLGALSTSRHPAVTALSSNGCFIMRVPRNQDGNWYGNVALLCFSGEPSTRLLASPRTPSNPQPPQLDYHLSSPPRHTAGFSPGGRYVGAFDMNCAFVWSTGTCEVIAQYRVQDFRSWIFNTGRVPLSYLVPTPVLGDHVVHSIPEEIATHVQGSEPDPRHNADESWVKCPFYDLSPNKHSPSKEDIMLFSSVMGEAPLVIANGLGTLGAQVSFDGKVELIVHPKYNPVFEQSHPSSENEPWYGDHVFWNWETSLPFYLPRASKDGRRFLLQGKLRAPLVIDIRKVV